MTTNFLCPHCSWLFASTLGIQSRLWVHWWFAETGKCSSDWKDKHYITWLFVLLSCWHSYYSWYVFLICMLCIWACPICLWCCWCILKNFLQIDKTVVCHYVTILLNTLLVCFNDESWPVRDGLFGFCIYLFLVLVNCCYSVRPVYPLHWAYWTMLVTPWQGMCTCKS